MKKRILSALLVFALLFSLCPTTVFAAPVQTLSGQTLVCENPLYPDAEYTTELKSVAAAYGASQTSSSSFGTVEEVAEDIRGYMKSRTENFTVYLHYIPTSTNQEAIEQDIMNEISRAFDLAMAHTGDPTEGDYIRLQWGRWSMDWSGAPSSGGFDISLTFTLDYFTTAAQEQEMDQAVEALLEELDLYTKNDYQKIRGIYDYICRNVTYDYDNLADTSNTLKNTAYAALINGTSVCQGYAALFYRLSLELGVDARLIIGTSSSQEHVWNIVELNELYYNADATWDSHMAAEDLAYQCFLVSDASFSDHLRSEAYSSEEFYAEYPMAASNYDPNDITEPTDPNPTEPDPTEPEPTEPDPTEPEASPHVHEEEIRNAKDATCTDHGYTGDVYCSECGEWLRDGERISATGHSYGKWIIEEYPSGGSDGGIKAHYCTVCGIGEYSHIGIGEEDHSNGYPVTVTCGEGGSFSQAIYKADPGHEVVLEVMPLRGAYLSEIICTSSNGVEVEPPRFYGDRNEYMVIAMPDGPLNIELVFAYAPTYNVNVITSEGGTVTLGIETAYEGDVFTFSTIPDEGYELVFIEVVSYGTYDAALDQCGSDCFQITMPDGDIDIIVTFDKKGGYPIEVYTAVGGIAYTSVSSAQEGEHFTLTVEPDPGYRVDQVYTYSEGTYSADGWEIGTNMFEIVMPDGALIIEVSFVLSDNPFIDVEEADYFYDPVLWAVTNGITSGVSANRFGPNNACTRAQVVTFLWRAAGSPEPVSDYNPFTDVAESDYFYKAVLWAVENGITSGTSSTTFGSANPCTRAQVVTFLWRACGSPEPSGYGNPFTDVKETDYFFEAVLFAVEYGITSGLSDTLFGSGNTCTRAHVVTFLYKTLHG